mmetsp:Transcript_16098/g.32407  ORF Transcript_16098/g.32407 Transcript_16098/m.32407 type:complete len:249 (-) Transcript_16098:233-979(-)
MRSEGPPYLAHDSPLMLCSVWFTREFPRPSMGGGPPSSIERWTSCAFSATMFELPILPAAAGSAADTSTSLFAPTCTSSGGGPPNSTGRATPESLSLSLSLSFSVFSSPSTRAASASSSSSPPPCSTSSPVASSSSCILLSSALLPSLVSLSPPSIPSREKARSPPRKSCPSTVSRFVPLTERGDPRFLLVPVALCLRSEIRNVRRYASMWLALLPSLPVAVIATQFMTADTRKHADTRNMYDLFLAC